jgi:hypothetical protein
MIPTFSVNSNANMVKAACLDRRVRFTNLDVDRLDQGKPLHRGRRDRLGHSLDQRTRGTLDDFPRDLPEISVVHRTGKIVAHACRFEIAVRDDVDGEALTQRGLLHVGTVVPVEGSASEKNLIRAQILLLISTCEAVADVYLIGYAALKGPELPESRQVWGEARTFSLH